MSGPRVWVDENDLRTVVEMASATDEYVTQAMQESLERVKEVLDPPSPLPLRPYRACMQGHGA